MHPQVFEINLDQESNRFIAGQVITGRVVLVLGKQKAVKGIALRFFGKGCVTWDIGISGLYSHNLYTESEVYADLKVIIFGRDDGREQILEPGRHEYCFSLQLPSSIPSSFEGEYGNIKYMLEASVNRLWKDDHTATTPVEIRGMVDLNSEPEAGLPVKIFRERNVGGLLCNNNGPMLIHFLLSKAGFVPGEYLQFGLEIRNGASVKISRIKVSLKKHTTYVVGSERKSQTEKLIRMTGPSVEVKGYVSWQNHFQIPDVPPNPLLGCKIMELKYYMEIKFILERWTSLKICTPVIIGCIPFIVPETKRRSVKLPVIFEENQATQVDTTALNNGAAALELESVPLITTEDQQEFGLPCIDWGSSACLAELEKITSRPVQTVPSFLLSASENLYAMSMGSCDKLSTNYEILDDRHIVFQDDDTFDACAAKLQSLLLQHDNEENDCYE